MSKIVLGLDISSTTIGWGLLQIDESTKSIKYITSGYIKPPKGDNIVERLLKTKALVQALLEKTKPDFIGIEDIIAFMPHRSSANTVITLAVFNRMICLLSFEFLSKNSELFPVMEIRRGIKIDEVPSKEDIAELVAKRLGITFPWVTNKKGKRIVENGDVADGLAVALYYAFVLTGKATKNKTEKKKRKPKAEVKVKTKAKRKSRVKKK